MIHVRRWDPTTKSCSAQDEALPASAADLAAGESIWIDLENPTPEEEAQVFEKFLPIHPLTLEDITKPRRDPTQGAHLPKVEEFPNYLFVVANPLPPGFGEPKPAGTPAEHSSARLRSAKRPQLSAVLTRNVLITHHYDDLRSIRSVVQYIARHGECTRRGPDFLFHLILDEMVDEYAPVVERIAEKLDRLEGRMFKAPTPEVLTRLLRLKRQVSYLRKTLILEREVLARLIRGEFALVETAEIVYYRNVYDHQVRYTELIESSREMVSDLMQTHLSAVSNRLNEVMKVLSMISTVVLPMTLVAGIYGMNFKYMPELEWEYGYPFGLAVMTFTGAASFALFKWRRWI